MIIKIGIKQVESLTFEMARELMSYNEPIPDFDTRRPNILESCLETPFQTYDKKDLYPGLVSKASILFYLMIKNHPFQNGNKRVALTTLVTFLYANDKMLMVDDDRMYRFTKWVAQSEPETKDGTVLAIENFVGKHVVEKNEVHD